MLASLAWLSSLGLLALLLAMFAAAQTQSQAQAPSPTPAPAWAILEDPGGTLNLEGIRARDAEFAPATKRSLNPGYSASAWWGRLQLQAPAGPAQQRWLVMRTARLEQVQLWVEGKDDGTGGWQRLDAGTSVPHERWPLDTPSASFPLALPGGQTTTVYLRLAGRTALTFDAQVCSPNACMREQQVLLALDAVVAGSSALVVVGCLLVAALQRQRSPLLVAGYALAYAVYELAYEGHGFQYLWPDATEWACRALNPLAMVTVALLVLTLCALTPASGAPGKLRRLLQALVLLLVPAIAWSLFGDYRAAAPAAISLSLAAVLLGAALGGLAWRHGAAQGGHVAAVGATTLLGAMPRYAYLLGAVPHSGWTVYLLPLTWVLNSLILMTAVLAHLRNLDRARLATQAALEQSRSSQAQRSRLLAYIGHDLRAPLAATVSYVRRLGAAPDLPTLQLRSTIERGVAHQLELIDELVAHARGEAEGLEMVPAAHFCHALLQDVAEQGAALAAAQDNRFDAVISPALPAVVRVDAKRLRQLLLNLLSNAARFTRGGHVGLQVSLINALGVDGNSNGAGTARLRCVVSDTGPGISEADLLRVFEPFWRGEAQAGTPGTGLGLAIARQLAEAMGGTLSATSSTGSAGLLGTEVSTGSAPSGSRFTLELPIEAAEPGDVQWPSLAASAPAPFGRGRTALVADADPASREHLAELLFAAEFEVVQAPDFQAASRLLQARPPDVLITEQDLPRGSGWALLEAATAALPAEAASVSRRVGRTPAAVLYSARPPQAPASLPPGCTFAAQALKPMRGEDWWALLAGLLEGSARPSNPTMR